VKLDEFPEIYHQTWVAHLTLMQLGFEPQDIRIHVGQITRVDTRDYLTVVMTTQQKIFAILMGPVSDTSLTVVEQWKQFVLEAQKLDAPHRMECVTTDVLTRIAMQITKTGIDIPELPKARHIVDSFKGVNAPGGQA